MKDQYSTNKSKYSWGMVIDLNKCTGCKACVIACKSENNLPTVAKSEAEKGRVNNWIEVKKMVAGEFPDAKIRYLPKLCNHCDNPPCTRVCPVRATYKNHEGLVAQIYTRCIGCRYCANACPYTVKTFQWFEETPTEAYKKMINPDVSVRSEGVVEKCSFCHHRLQKAKEVARMEKRELEEKDYQPACVQACPANAMTFGNLNDRRSEVYRLSRAFNTFRLLEDLGTKPKVIYISEGEWHG
jgi:molybdopterin-containing oxidoreductase family iron-sulfur binding subunit